MFQFKQFKILQDKCAIKVCTDSCLFGAWVADHYHSSAFIPDNVLDIGAGTGLLSLMLAQKLSSSITAIEIMEDAANQAKENVELSKWHHRINILKADIKDFNPEQKFRLIISNPPFFENDLQAESTSKNVAKHNQGLHLIQLVAAIENNLSDHGKFAVMLPTERMEILISLAADKNFFPEHRLDVRQTPSHNFFRSFVIFGKNKEILSKEEMTIKEASGEYSTRFVHLLKDYYLYL